MKKSLILCTLLASIAFSSQDKKVNIENYLENNNSVDNTRTEFTSEYQDAAQLDAAKGFFNYKEVVYSRIQEYRAGYSKEEVLSVATIVPTFNVATYQLEEKLKREALDKAEDNEPKAEELKDIIAQGYCKFRNDIEVTKLSEYSYLDCEFDDIGSATLAVLIVPDFFAQALVAQPLYISTSDSYGKAKRLNTTNGAILNATKSSINIANLVNDFMLEKILASAAYQGATATTTQANAYLSAKSEARKSEEVTYVATGDGTTEAVKTSKTQMPEKADYITGAAIELVSSVVKIVGKSVLSNINYSFKINKGSIVYADVVVSGASSDSNNGGLLKKTKLVNKESINKIDASGDYDFIPNDSDLEIEIDGNKSKDNNSSTSTSINAK